MPPAGDLPTVAWWEERAEGIASWLLVGPPPAPLTDGAWLHQLAVTQGPGEWAVASQPSLGPLPEPVTARLRDPIGPAGVARSAVLQPDGTRLPGDAGDELREQCAHAALDLVARRLGEPITPRESGVLLLRLRADGARTSLDIGPAIDEKGWLSRGVHVDLRGGRVRWDGGVVDLQLGDASFAMEPLRLGGTEVELPFASSEITVPDGAACAELCAAVDVTLPTLWHSEVPEPLVTLELRPAAATNGR